ncbi:MAG TPA: hypothetical protein VGK00_15125 [Anaerolineales bacterium]
MNHVNILKRSFNITLNYRVLWIFGILLALTGGGGGGGNGGGGSGGNGGNGGNFPGFNGQNPFGHMPQITPAMISTMIGLGIAFACLVLILIVIASIVRYVSETAVIRMVDQHENSGEKLGLRQGFRLGWSRAAWKMFLMDLLVGVVFVAGFLVLLAIAALPLLVFTVKNATPLHILGGVLSAGLGLLVIFTAIIVGIALSLVMRFAQRVVVLEDLGVRASIKRGFDIVRGRLGDIILMAVLMFGVGLAWLLVSIPVILAVIVVAALIGGLPALLAGTITNLFVQGAWPWIVGAIVGAPIFLLVVIVPSALISGWEKIFTSSAWTLTYREALALVTMKPATAQLPPSEPA